MSTSENHNQSLGKVGEELAATHLTELGYDIIGRNISMKRGEIDIIAREGGDLVFIEVKTRKGEIYGSAAEAVTVQKIRHLARAAQEYLYRNDDFDASCRCDVVAVTYFDDRPEIELFRNAAELGEYV